MAFEALVTDDVCGIRHENDLWRASKTQFPRDLNGILHTTLSSSPFYLSTRKQFPNRAQNFGSLWFLQHWVPDGVCGIRHENDLWRASETRFPRDLNVIVHTPSSSSPFYLGTRKPSKNHLLWLSVPQERKQNNAKNKCCQEMTD